MTCCIIYQLQQYRQKKDNKGSNSKSSSKGGKSGHDSKAGAVAEAAEKQQNVPDVELSKHDAGDTVGFSESGSRDTTANDTASGSASNDTSITLQHEADGDRFKHDSDDITALPEPNSGMDTLASDAASSKSGHGTESAGISEAASTQEPTEGGDDAVTLSESAAHDSSVGNAGPSPKTGVGIACLLDGHDVDISVAREDGSSSPVLQDVTNNVPAVVSEERSEDPNLLLPTDSSSELERERGDEQVTDVGLCLYS